MITLYFYIFLLYFLISFLYLLLRRINKERVYSLILDIYISIYVIYILIPFTIFSIKKETIEEIFLWNFLQYLQDFSIYTSIYPLLILLFFLFGANTFFFLNKYISKTKIIEIEYKKLYYSSNIETISWFITLLFLLFIIIIYFTVTFSSLLMDFTLDLSVIKYDLINKTGWKHLIILFIILNPLILIISLSNYKRSNNGIFIIIILLSLLIQSISILLGFRVYILLYLLIFYILYVFYSQKDISLYKKLIFFLSMLLLYNLLTIIIYEDFLYGLFRAINRLFAGLKGMFICFDLAKEKFFLGQTYIWKIASLLPGEQITLQGYISPFEGIILEPTIVGELYINFGYFGILISFIFGFFSTMILQYSLKKARNNLLFLIITISYSVFLFRSVMGGLESYILIFLYLFMFIVIYFIYKIVKLLLFAKYLLKENK